MAKSRRRLQPLPIVSKPADTLRERPRARGVIDLPMSDASLAEDAVEHAGQHQIADCSDEDHHDADDADL